jgi:hypothetical protein
LNLKHSFKYRIGSELLSTKYYGQVFLWVTFAQLRQEASRKTSLKHLNIGICKPGSLHPVWNTVEESPMDIIRAGTKIRLLTGLYRLQSVVAKQSGGKRICPICPLCKQTSETLPHFLLSCATLVSERNDFIKKLENILCDHRTAAKVIFSSEDLLTQLVMDCTMPVLELPRHLHDRVESLSRLYCYSLHVKMTILLSEGSEASPGSNYGITTRFSLERRDFR